MSKLIFLIFLLCSFQAWGATCTATSRNNYSTNQVLTSTALNADFNQLVTKANAMDAGCLTAGTLEADALNATDFSVMLKAIKEGCKVVYSTATQVSIGKCLASVNGAFVSTTLATTASFGCTNCSAEVASTVYYVYIATGSTGSTLTPLILTGAPNEDGYDASGNKVLARFYNNAASDIDPSSVDLWHVNKFIPSNTEFASCAHVAGDFTGFGTVVTIETQCKRSGGDLIMKGNFTVGTPTATEARMALKMGGATLLTRDTSTIPTIQLGGFISKSNTIAAGFIGLLEASKAYMTFGDQQGAGGLTKRNGDAICAAAQVFSLGNIRIPIVGWSE